MIRFVCVNVGPAYSMAYVAILADMIERNASILDSFSIQCVTDRPGELPQGVGAIAADPTIPPSWWAKLQLFSPSMPWELGDRIVYLDLDVAITGRLEELTETKGIIKDWIWPGYNSSVMVWDHGEHRQVWERFTPDVMTRAPGPIVPAESLPKGQLNGGDQEWITEVSEWPLLPQGWCVSYRFHAKDWPPNAAKVVCFHGAVKPAQITSGWVPNVWKIGGFTSLPVMTGVNVTHAALIENIKANAPRDLPWFTGFRDDSPKPIVVVGGAPSMLDHISDIRGHARRGCRIVTVNNAWRVLVDNGITPDVHIMLDARPENAEFVKGAPAGMRFLIASQCHPDLFDALEGREVVVWHSGFGDNAAVREALDPWWNEGPDQRPCVLVPGGGTVGLRALWLCAFSGFKTVHVYGLDSSYSGDRHHAYPQALNDADQVMEVTMQGKRYRCARWMVRQAEEFKQAWSDLKAEGVTLHVHGSGLIPDIAKLLRAEERGMTREVA